MISLMIEKLYNIWKYIKRPEDFVYKICTYDNYRFAPLVPDKIYLKCLFKKLMKKKLSLTNPTTFSEKLQWLKLYDRQPEYAIMADKIAAKKYVSEKIGVEYIIPTIEVYNSASEIPFEELPERYVIKCSHDSGSVFICNKDVGINSEEIKKAISKSLNTNFYWSSREWVYKNIKPRVIIEEFITDKSGTCPVDYKFFCFNGKMEVFKIDYNRFTKRAANYYDKDCNLLDFGKINSIPDPSIKLELPENFEEMVAITEKLSSGIPFLRVDLYSVNNHIYFGEMTFYPSSGIEPFTGNGDFIMGEMLKLPKKKRR